MKLLKVKIDNQFKLEVKYQSEVTDELKPAIISINFPEPCPPTLIDALTRMKVYVNQICEFPKKDINKIEVRGISISYHEERIGIIFTSILRLENSVTPMNINTPLKYDTGEDEKVLLPEGCMSSFLELTEEVSKFMKEGSRQLKLFDLAA